MERDILLISEPSVITELRTISELLGVPVEKNLPAENNVPTVLERVADYKFVNPFHDPEYFLCRSFPSLFPYGRGCLSDENALSRDYLQHTKMMLLKGGGPQARRFQKFLNFIFTMYFHEMKKRVGGVSCKAQNSNLDDHLVDEVNVAPTVSELEEAVDFLHTRNPQSMEEILDVDTTPEAIKKLIKRLVPYSSGLQGTKMHIMHERAKLMAMLPSPVITNENAWRYFITFAPADVYDPRLYDITIDEKLTDKEPQWPERQQKVQFFFLI